MQRVHTMAPFDIPRTQTIEFVDTKPQHRGRKSSVSREQEAERRSGQGHPDAERNLALKSTIPLF